MQESYEVRPGQWPPPDNARGWATVAAKRSQRHSRWAQSSTEELSLRWPSSGRTDSVADAALSALGNDVRQAQAVLNRTIRAVRMANLRKAKNWTQLKAPILAGADRFGRNDRRRQFAECKADGLTPDPFGRICRRRSL